MNSVCGDSLAKGAERGNSAESFNSSVIFLQRGGLSSRLVFVSRRLIKPLRFCIIGLACFGLGLVILAGLHGVAGVNYLAAYVVSFVVTNIAGYLLNARFTFASKVVNHVGAIRYMAVNAGLLCVNALAMSLLVGRLHMWYLSAAIFLAAINTPFSFFGQRLFTYRARARDRIASA